MFSTTIALNITEIIILQLGAIIFGVALHFFLVNRKNLKEATRPKKKVSVVPPLPAPAFDFTENAITALSLQEPTAKAKKNQSLPVVSGKQQKNNAVKEDVVDSFKESVGQQEPLSGFVFDVEDLQGDTNNELEKEIDRLQTLLDKKDDELQRVKQQGTITQKVSARIEDVYKDFDLLQSKIAGLEKQAMETTALTIELEDVKQSYNQLQKDLLRKQARLEEMVHKNQNLHHQLSETEDKLSEANVQRQQLSKKLQLLQDMNADIQSTADSNKKLQTELRRIGELESMLDMMHDERDQLLKRQVK